MFTHQGNRFPWGREQAPPDGVPSATVAHPQASLTWGSHCKIPGTTPHAHEIQSPGSKVSLTNQGRGPWGSDGPGSEGPAETHFSKGMWQRTLRHQALSPSRETVRHRNGSVPSACLCKQTHASLSARNSSSRTGGGSELKHGPTSPSQFRGRARCSLDSGPPCPPPLLQTPHPQRGRRSRVLSPMPGTRQEHLQLAGETCLPHGDAQRRPSPAPQPPPLGPPASTPAPQAPTVPTEPPELCPHALASQPTHFTSRGFDLHLRPQLGPMT